MRVINLSEVDAQQVKAILMTHAELQDLEGIKSTDLLARMSADNDDSEEMGTMIECLTEQVDDFTEDSDNLKRLAALF